MSAITKHPAWDATESTEANAARILPQLVSDYFSAGREICSREPALDELHMLRLAGKRLRYTLEMFRGCYGPSLLEHIETLGAIQDDLGAISDCAATEKLLLAEDMGGTEDGQRLIRFLRLRTDAASASFAESWRARIDAPGSESAWLETVSRPNRDTESDVA